MHPLPPGLVCRYRLHSIEVEKSLDPLGMFRRACLEPYPFFLDGSAPGVRGGRFSFVGCAPCASLTARGRRLVLAFGDERRCGEGDPFEALRAFLEGGALEAGEEGPQVPFRGGTVGYLGYGLRRHLEHVPDRHGRTDDAPPDLHVARYTRLFAIDGRDGRVLALGCLASEEDAGEFRRWVERFVDEAQSLAAPSPRVEGVRIGPGGLRSNFRRAEFLEAVARVREYILAGDVFQANLAQRFSARFSGEAAVLYERLRRASPTPMGGFFRFPGGALLSSSPERFLRLRGRRVETRPIKGTRRRGRDEREDARLAQELLASPKDRAELAMIVDLERNDLGRVCRVGSVRVVEDRVLETHAVVHHLVATVAGELRPEVDRVDLLRGTFPGGSITGAPKLRAMEILDEIEPDGRGPYTGCLGYFGFDGTMDLNILIRTLVCSGEEISFHVGGGIVADSDPASEYEETLHKAAGMREALLGPTEPRVDLSLPVSE